MTATTQWESTLVAVTRGQLGGSYGHAMDKEANPTDIFVDFLQGCRKSVKLSSLRKVLVVCHPGSAADLTVVVVVSSVVLDGAVPERRRAHDIGDDKQPVQMTSSADPCNGVALSRQHLFSGGA